MKYIHVYIVLLVFIGCKYNATDSYLIDFEKKMEIKSINNLSEALTPVNFIKLETTEESLVGRRLGKIMKNHNIYYISYDFTTLIIYNDKGEYLNKINKIGGGPGEYYSLLDFDILEDGKIAILDNKKILLYNEFGDYLSGISMELQGTNIKSVKNNKFLICGSGESYQVYLVDIEGNILDKSLKTGNTRTTLKNAPFINFKQDKVLFHYEFSNGIVVYDENTGKFEEHQFLSSSAKVADSKETNKLKKNEGEWFYEKNPSINVIPAIISYKDYLFFTHGNLRDNFNMYIYDCSKEKMIYSLNNSVNDDITNLNIMDLMNGLAGSMVDDAFVTVVDFSLFMHGLNNFGRDYISENYPETIINFIDKPNLEDENPVLIELRVN